MKSIAIAALLPVLASAHEHPKDYDADVSHWQVVALPSAEKFDEHWAFLNRANMSGIEWNVRLEKGVVKAVLGEGYVETLADDRPTFSLNLSKDGDPRTEPNAVHRVSDGWLASYNRGEFGGAVWWFSNDGSDRRALSKHRVSQFITH